MLFGLDQEGGNLFQLCLNVWIRNCWRQFLELGASFFSRWCLIYVQFFSNVIFGLARDLTSNVELRSKDYKHFCYKLREMPHFEKDFGFEAVWDLRYCFITWFWAQRTCTTNGRFNWNCAFCCEFAKMHHFRFVSFLSCWTCAHLYSNMGCEFRLVGQFSRQG